MMISHVFLLSIDGWQSSLLLAHKSPLVSNSHSKSDISLKKFIDWWNPWLHGWVGFYRICICGPSAGFRRSCGTVQADRRLVDTWAEAAGWWWCFVCLFVPKSTGVEGLALLTSNSSQRKTGEMLRKRCDFIDLPKKNKLASEFGKCRNNWKQMGLLCIGSKDSSL